MKSTIFIILFALGSLFIIFSSATSKSDQNADLTIVCSDFSISSTVPTDALILNQYCANAFAWEAFLALNWPAKKNGSGGYVDGVPADVPFSEVGEPGDLSPTVWETYADANAVFTNTAPPKWEENQIVPLGPGEDCSESKIMRFFNKQTSPQEEDIQDLFQATGEEWLIAQNSGLVWYEVLVNKKEFEFIYNKKLYDQDSLWAYGEREGAIWLPEGAMELKASWLQFSDEAYENNENNIQERYKIVRACVPRSVAFDEKGNLILEDYQPTYIGLVGLHIITKTPTAPQLIWATFEQVDNVPTEGTDEMSNNYTFYNASCSERCEVNTPFPVVKGEPVDTSIPNQTTRLKMNSIGSDAVEMNKVAKKLITEQNPNSVWQHYQLINAQWPNTALSDVMNGTGNSLENGGAYPTVQVMGNPVSETYIQEISCIECHDGSTISRGGKTLTTGYSFVFLKAQKQTN